MSGAGPTPAPPESARRARISLATAVGLAALGLLLVAAASTARWVTAVPADPALPGATRVPLKGSALVPAAVPLALVGVAGIVAAGVAGSMARGALRVVAALLVVASGVGVVVATAGTMTDLENAVGSNDSARQASAASVADTSAVGWVATAGGVALLAAGGVALRHRRRWPGLAARYERTDEPGGAGKQRPATSTWDALERGEDPTREP